MDNRINFGKKTIGDGCPTFITFEAGPTHNGLDSAKQLVQLASVAGADAIKFQIFDPEELISDKTLEYSYEVLVNRKTGQTEKVTEPLYDIFRRRSLSNSEWKELKHFADDLNLEFFATIGDELGLSLVNELGCRSVKIASADVNHHPFLRKIANKGFCIQIDTGNSTFGEIEEAVDIIKSEGNDQIIIHNCPSGYPALLESVNLKMLKTLKDVFECPVAYSDHSPGEIMDIAAVAMGANMVEKTITLDRTTRSVEHIMSLEPNEMNSFVKNIRQLEIAMGSPRRVMSNDEQIKRLNLRRSILLDEGVKKGQKLQDVKVKFKRPGFGIPPSAYQSLLSKSFSCDIEKDTVLRWKHLI